MKKDFKDFKEFIKDKNVAVVGIGVSNIPLINFLVELKARVSAFDKKTEEKLGSVAQDFKNKGVKLVLGEDYLEKLNGYDVVFKTPSMRIDSPALVKAKNQGAYITSEMEEFIKYCPAKIFGITGSDGKTTTTTLVSLILEKEGYKTWTGGNIGTPLFANIQQIKETDKVVLELSSFQLMTIKDSPEVAVITNLSPNHLDMHKGMEEYTEAKENIYKFQGSKDRLVLNKDNEITNSMTHKAPGRIQMFSIKEKIDNGAYFDNNYLYINGHEVCRKEEIKMRGMHNIENLLAAFCAVSEDVSIESMRYTAVNFTNVEHRIEFVRELNGIKYYNDSIATSPTRTISGLNSFEKPVILIAGGYDKHIPFEPLAEEGYKKIKTLILVGATKNVIKETFEKVLKENMVSLPIIIADTFEEAVYKAKENAVYGDIITLSPACAAFDLFDNFEARGKKFKEIVLAMK